MRFRTSGNNHEGRPWVLAAGLMVLAKQIDEFDPERHAADGTVASAQHDQNNPSSDHRPKPYSGAGVVRALDFGEHTEDDAFKILEAIRKSKDSRVKYCIHESRLFSSYGSTPYEWRPYTGASPHSSHGHVSTLESGDTNTKPWNIGEGMAKGPNGEPNWDKVSDWAKTAWSEAWAAGVTSDTSDPKDIVEMEQLMVLFKRAKVI